MAHKQQIDYCSSVRNRFPHLFQNCNVLDIGSLDINGNNHYLFTNNKYTGVDVGVGRNVDVVCNAHEYDTQERFDVVISTECFEHDKFYPETIKNAIRLLKSGGLFLFTCASTGRAEHGTSRSEPMSSPLSYGIFNDYYKNLTEEDIRMVFNPSEYFSEFEFQYQPQSFDLYFWGIKK